MAVRSVDKGRYVARWLTAIWVLALVGGCTASPGKTDSGSAGDNHSGGFYSGITGGGSRP
jgi:hypothetical protein